MTESALIYKTPIGPLKLVATDEGICAVKWLFGKHSDSEQQQQGTASEESKKPHTTKKGKQLEQGERRTATSKRHGAKSKANEHLQVCRCWLDAYFDGTLLKVDPPKPPLVLPTIGTEFFHSVWSTLASTGVGETVSYKELARLSGRPNAARAVGQAVKKHCLPILVPCHRVVRSGRGPKGGVETGDYSGGEGPATKEWLLQHELKMLQESM